MDAVEIGMYCFSLIVGLGIGALFYMGLWWTISVRLSSEHWLLWWWVSFIARLVIVASAFYLVASVHFARYVLLFLGFILSRKMIVKKKAAG